MFGLNDGMRYYVCQRYVRMNLGINGLYKLVSQEMDLPPLSGAVFIFFSKNRQQVKLLRGTRLRFVNHYELVWFKTILYFCHVIQRFCYTSFAALR